MKLVGDITYIRTWTGWLYLATVIDCHTRAVIGWSMATHMRTSLICDALSMAAGRGHLEPHAIFYIDPLNLPNTRVLSFPRTYAQVEP